MPGLVPGIHVLCAVWEGVDGRDKPGHDAVECFGGYAAYVARNFLVSSRAMTPSADTGRLIR